MSNRSIWIGVILAAIACELGTASAQAASFSELYVFGDSFSDTGNVAAATFGLIPSSPPYYQGRFSNGPLWIDHLAATLELPLVANGANPRVVVGNNFAAGGARVATDVPVPLLGTIPSILNQASFVTQAVPTLPSTALYVVYGGYNDLNLATDPTEGFDAAAQEAIVRQAAAGIGQTMQVLADAGARDFLVPNLADFGITPESQARGTTLRARELTEFFNAELDSLVRQFADTHPGTLYRLDTFGFADEVIADATQNNGSIFGITNVSDPLFSDEGSLLDPDTLLFADSIHISAVAHRYLGQAAAAAVPEPVCSGLWLFAGAWFLTHRGRRSAT